MASSTVYALIDALVAQARTALPNVTVHDGFGISDDPGDFLMIGVDDPDTPNATTSASMRQEPGPLGTNRPRDETGEITCVALSWNGDADPSAARAGCKAITDGMETLVRAVGGSPSLGVSGVLWLGYGTTVDLLQDQSEAGAQALVIFKIAFRSRI